MVCAYSCLLVVCACMQYFFNVDSVDISHDNMPRVNIEHVVSFSSEDHDYSAAGLVKVAAGGKGWRVSRGETRGAVVLQLSRAVRVASVTVGAVNAATVEVLVGRAEASDHYEVLVPTCILLSPAESRRAGSGGADGARVRSFTESSLTDAAKQCWDRMRLVLTQPYNKHVQFGVSFVQVYEPEIPSSTPTCPLPLELNVDSDEEFSPGELFAQRMQTVQSVPTQAPAVSTDTDAQIRRATSQVLKNIDDSATKLKRAPINKPTNHKDAERPHTSIDKPHLDDHKQDKNYDLHDKVNIKRDRSHDEPDTSNRSNDEHDTKLNKHDNKHGRHTDNNKQLQSDRDTQRSHKRTHTEYNQSKDERSTSGSGPKRHRNNNDRAKASSDSSHSSGNRWSNTERASGASNDILRGVVFVMSGYEHPRRGNVRRAAETHGARAKRDWGADCTHLICAFPNTPKMRAVLRSSNVCVVTAEWVEASVAAGRKLPWRWFATDPKERETPPKEQLQADNKQLRDQSEECDTDDEIERVMQNKAKGDTSRHTNVTDDDDISNDDAASDHDATVLHTPADEYRVTKQTYSDIDSEAYNADTRPSSPAPGLAPARIQRCLGVHPALRGRTVAGVGLTAGEAGAVRRVVRAHGADWMEEAAVAAGSEPHCWVTRDWMHAHHRPSTT